MRNMWQLISPSGIPVNDLSEIAGRGGSIVPDVLLVDFYYDRSDYWERRIRLLQESVKSRTERKQITEYIAGKELSRFSESTDSREWESQIVPFWEKMVPHLRLRPRASIILLGCSQYVNLYSKFKEAFSKCYQKSASDPRVPKRPQSIYERSMLRRDWSPYTTHENLMGPAYFRGKSGYKRIGSMELWTFKLSMSTIDSSCCSVN